ncbi:meiosis-specific kinetochore protein isoform X2 [Oxyura jamaicensis]|uniref:meiosis-specific kinetochore protein isoform X2 n=1 Tax=Oxyura jamaicensis TaxID=8884 RepID=UPI0015A60B6A|nr:meiosis-specific kinetochore protein isoform X2 [Oxyura jamaicensis]
MERCRWPVGKAPRKKRCSSPLPGGAAALGRPGPLQPCRRRLFGNAAPRGPQPGCLKGKSSMKTLPKIKENLEVTEVSHSSNQSMQVNVKETPSLEKNEENIEDSTVPLKESLIISFESRDSLKSADVTSDTGMTLPTGVSTFLLECLDTDSTEDYNTAASESLNSCPSPETFRDEEGLERSNPYFEDFVKYKNSTLLDSSKAVTIDKIPQISNLSAILEPVLEDFQDQYTRKRPSKCNDGSSELSVSTTLAGKKICKITTARERTPDLKTGMRCSSPVGPERKPDVQTAKPKGVKCKRNEEFSNPLEDGASSLSQLESVPANVAAKSVGVAAEALPSRQTDAVVQMNSTVLIMEKNKALENSDYAQRAKLDPLCYGKEICSIVRTSPGRRSSRHHQIPVNTKKFCVPEGVPEDTITSTKNWIYCKRR